MLSKWIVIPVLLILITVAVLVVYGGKRYSNYYLSPLASFPHSINGLKRTWFFCEDCLNGKKCEAEDIKQCKAITLPDRINALVAAAGRANIEAVSFLVEVAKTDVNGVAGDTNGTPLMSAAYYGTKRHQIIAEFLLSHGANVNTVVDAPPIDTALSIAIWKNNVDFAGFLLMKGANPSLTADGLRENAACKLALAYNRTEMVSIITGCCDLIIHEPERMPDALKLCRVKGR